MVFNSICNHDSPKFGDLLTVGIQIQNVWGIQMVKTYRSRNGLGTHKETISSDFKWSYIWIPNDCLFGIQMNLDFARLVI